MTVAYIMMKASEHFGKRINQKVLKAIERHKKARAIGWKLLKDERYKITARPSMTLNDAKKLVEECGLTWKEFGPFYNRAKKREENKCKKCGNKLTKRDKMHRFFPDDRLCQECREMKL